MILKFQLTKFDRGLAFQVIKQTDKFLNLDETLKIEFQGESTKLKIISEHATKFDLNNFELHLRGSSSNQNYTITTTDFADNELRDKWYDYILTAIQEWAERCSSFEEIHTKKFPKLKKSGYSFEI